MKRTTKRRRHVARLGKEIRRIEKRQNRMTRDILDAVVHLLEEYVPAEPVPGPKPKRTSTSNCL